MKRLKVAAVLAAIFLATISTTRASAEPAVTRPAMHRVFSGLHGVFPAPAHRPVPWIEGVTPPLEDRLFGATYRVLPNHNVLKVYVFNAGGYESAGIRFSARVPHTVRDRTEAELDREAVQLIRTTFAQFPDVQTVDIWATIPVAQSQATTKESTVFSVSADRATYVALRAGRDLSDDQFLDAFGRVWVSPEVPQ